MSPLSTPTPEVKAKVWPRLAHRLAQFVNQPWVTAMVREEAIEATLQTVHPMLSLTRVRARVVRIIDETSNTKTFVLQPNAQWRGARSGQFVRLELELGGRLVHRVYSLSSRGGARRLAITVRLQEGGLVSGHLHRNTRVGDVFTLSQAMGEFALPTVFSATLPAKMLLLSAGSGITPVMAMLRDLRAQNFQGDLVFVHVCRNAADQIFAADLQAMAAQWPALQLHIHHTEASGRLQANHLQSLVPDLAQRATWLCGPAAWMDSIHTFWSEQGIAAPLHSERFGSAPRVVETPGTPVVVSCTAVGKTFTTQGSESLLAQAERAGLQPKHGCRMGICHSCQCTKASGTVQNLLTGEVSSQPNQLIRLCVSSARSDVALVL